MPGNGIAGTLGRGAARECVNHLLAQALSITWGVRESHEGRRTLSGYEYLSGLWT